MVFSNSQIQDVLDILQRHQLVFIAQQLGAGYLSANDRAILTAAGIDLNQFTNVQGILDHAFAFGLLAEALGDQRAQKMNYAQFQRFLKSGQFVPLTEAEEFALEQLKNRAYTDITGLGSRIKQGTSNVIIKANQQQLDAIRNVIKEKTIQAVGLRVSTPSLAGDLARATEDWGRDWLRIAYYLTHEAFNGGRAQSILKNYGADAEVYFDVYEDACKWCRELLLEDPEDPDSKPKIFKLSEIIANGNNIGRRAAELKATISPIHPYCRCTINHKKPGFEWDSDLRAFTKPVKRVSKNPALANVTLDIKVSKG